MAQYKAGTVSVTNGSSVVAGSGTAWLSNIEPGDGFTVAGTRVVYDVASVDSDNQLTLSAPYMGASAGGQVYAIWRDFTTNYNIPELSQGDIETATVVTRAMRKIDSAIPQGAAAAVSSHESTRNHPSATTDARGFVEKATTTEAQTGIADKFPDAAGVHAAFIPRGYFGSMNSATLLSNAGGTADDASLKNGRYIVQPSIDTGLPPGANNGTLEHVLINAGGGGYGHQTYISYLSNTMWLRRISAGSFSAWRQVFHTGNVLGTVSVSGGLVTGAIIERGSNANGEYVKFADGTMICTHTSATSNSGDMTWTFPATFATKPAKIITPTTGVTGVVSVYFINESSGISADYRGYDSNNNRLAMTVSLTAIGRWY